MKNKIKDAYKRYLEELNLDKERYRKGNEPFWLNYNKRTKIAFLLIHGFSASPWEMRELGDFLYCKGFNVYGMRLPGHGTSYKDLLEIKWQDWYMAVEKAYRLISPCGEKIIIGGLSTGGNLALYFAANNIKVAGVISISSALYFMERKIILSGMVKYFRKYHKKDLDKDVMPFYYDKRSISAIYEVYKLAIKLRRKLKDIQTPVLIIQSKMDSVVKSKSAKHIYQKIGSTKKKIVMLEGSSHVLTISDNNTNKVFEEIIDWINSNSKCD